jgi:hypothetical protein
MEADTLPDAHIAQLVQEERAEGSVDDLLDDHRPRRVSACNGLTVESQRALRRLAVRRLLDGRSARWIIGRHGNVGIVLFRRFVRVSAARILVHDEGIDATMECSCGLAVAGRVVPTVMSASSVTGACSSGHRFRYPVASAARNKQSSENIGYRFAEHWFKQR